MGAARMAFIGYRTVNSNGAAHPLNALCLPHCRIAPWALTGPPMGQLPLPHPNARRVSSRLDSVRAESLTLVSASGAAVCLLDAAPQHLSLPVSASATIPRTARGADTFENHDGPSAIPPPIVPMFKRSVAPTTGVHLCTPEKSVQARSDSPPPLG